MFVACSHSCCLYLLVFASNVSLTYSPPRHTQADRRIKPLYLCYRLWGLYLSFPNLQLSVQPVLVLLAVVINMSIKPQLRKEADLLIGGIISLILYVSPSVDLFKEFHHHFQITDCIDVYTS